MSKLRNPIEKLVSEGKVKSIPAPKAYQIYLKTYERMKNYDRTYAKRNHASHELAKKNILTSNNHKSVA